jgi:hypothetical protein
MGAPLARQLTHVPLESTHEIVNEKVVTVENVDAVAESRDLARRLQKMAAGIKAARSAGVPVSVPPEVRAACLALLQLNDGGGPGTPMGAPQAAMADVPLRKRLLQVLVPGEEFTVSDVAERLAALGVPAPANAISNALGSWVSAGTLRRLRKGHYLCPLPGSPSGEGTHRHGVDPGAGITDRKERLATSGEIQTRRAV